MKVFTAASGNTAYTEDTDYSFDAETGVVTRLSGAIPVAASKRIGYKWLDESKVTAAVITAGAEKLLDVESTAGLRPKILIAPGFTSQVTRTVDKITGAPVTSALEPVATKLRAVIIADGPDTTDAEAIAYRGLLDSRRIFVVDLRIAIHRNQTSGHRVTLADRGQYGAVAAHWQDLEAGEKVRTRAGEGEPVYTLRHPYPNAAEAQAAAQAKLRALNRGTGTLSLTLKSGMPALLAETNKPANPALAAGTRLALSGFRPGVDGDWVLTRVTHEISSSGYTTQVEAETPNEKS